MNYEDIEVGKTYIDTRSNIEITIIAKHNESVWGITSYNYVPHTDSIPSTYSDFAYKNWIEKSTYPKITRKDLLPGAIIELPTHRCKIESCTIVSIADSYCSYVCSDGYRGNERIPYIIDNAYLISSSPNKLSDILEVGDYYCTDNSNEYEHLGWLESDASIAIARKPDGSLCKKNKWWINYGSYLISQGVKK